MGLISRIRRITTARIENFLSSVEDPEVIFPQLVREMAEQVRAATDAEAKAMASVKRAEREVADVAEKLERLGKGAALAMEKGDEGTARDAVVAQIDLETTQQHKKAALEQAQATYEDARNARLQSQKQLDELNSKKDEIISRSRVANNQKKIERTVSGPKSSADSILDTVARLEGQVEETEAELQVSREISGGSTRPSLDKRLDELEKESEIEKRLAALKAETKSDAS